MGRVITVGMTGAQFIAALNNIGKVYDVTDYGAVHNGSTDDTVAIQAAINAAVTAGGGVVYFPIGIYVIAGALQTNIGGVNYKSQLYIPQVNYDSTTRCAIKLMGEVQPNFLQSLGINSVVTPTSGVILKSTLVSSTPYSYVIASIGASGNFDSNNYNDCSAENIQIQLTPDGSSRLTLGGIGFNNAANALVRRVSVFPYNFNLVNSGIPQNNCIGIAMPKENCEHINVVEDCNVGGFESGFLCGEHTSLIDTVANCCKYGYNFGTNSHHVRGARIATFWCQNDIYFSGSAYVKINGLQTEWASQGKWYDDAYVILDANNYGHGEISYSVVEHNVGFNNARFNKSGGTKLQCYPMAFADATSFTLTGSTDAEKLASVIALLKAKGLAI